MSGEPQLMLLFDVTVRRTNGTGPTWHTRMLDTDGERAGRVFIASLVNVGELGDADYVACTHVPLGVEGPGPRVDQGPRHTR